MMMTIFIYCLAGLCLPLMGFLFYYVDKCAQQKDVISKITLKSDQQAMHIKELQKMANYPKAYLDTFIDRREDGVGC